jgi:DNA processing protein
VRRRAGCHQFARAAERGATRYDLLLEPDPAPFAETLWDEMEGLAPAELTASPAFAPTFSNEDERREDLGAPALDAPSRLRIEALLGPSPVVIDDLARAGGCTIGETRPVLQELEIEGRIERHGGTGCR